MMQNSILENEFIARLVSGFPKSPLQRNQLQESDAELLQLPGQDKYLAVTIDGLVEEIELGLLRNPYQIGWTAVMSALSDLAAVGAQPLAVLLSESLPPDLSSTTIQNLQLGMGDACRKAGTFVLGGDTNRCSQLQLVVTALGLCSEPLLTRVGAQPGDLLFASGLFGRGNLIAWHNRLAGQRSPSPEFRPIARLTEGQLLPKFAHCCMDSSDGLLTTLDQLMRLNHCGFDLQLPAEQLLDPVTRKFASSAKLSPLLLLAGPVGEYELLFTVPEERLRSFNFACQKIGWQPVKLGRVIPEQKVYIRISGHKRSVDTLSLRNAFARDDQSVEKQMQHFLTLINEVQS